MAKPTATYTFSSTKENCDIVRIMRENAFSNVIVLSRKAVKGCPDLTLARGVIVRKRLEEAGHRPVCGGLGYSVFVGDLHAIALGIIETKVEAY